MSKGGRERPGEGERREQPLVKTKRLRRERIMRRRKRRRTAQNLSVEFDFIHIRGAKFVL